MPHVRAVFASLTAFCLSVCFVSAQAAKADGAASSKSPVTVRSVHFDPVKIGNQKNEWIRMQVELQANFNPETKVSAEEKAGKKAANKQWVDKIKVTVTEIFKPLSAKDATEFSYYRASATVLTMEIGSPRSVYFYLPGDIVKRDRLKMQPDYYYVQLDVGGNEVPLFSEAGRINPDMLAAVHKQFVNKKDFDGARDLADRGASANAGMLRPQYMVPYAIFDTLPQGSPSPEFIREDATR
ncbi:MAG: hypothetical protein RJA95_367 [Verrucomicrobiota bacterium]